MDPSLHFGDGMNTHLALMGSPLTQTDPDGLFVSAVGMGVATGVSAGMSAVGTLQDAHSGLMTFFGLYTMLRNYSAFQEFDVEWALDWSAADDAYTGSANFSSLRGSWALDDPGFSGGSGDLYLAGKYGREGVTVEELAEKRREWNNLRRKIWRAEAAYNPDGGWSKDDLKRMRKGLAPVGYEIHHNRPLAKGGQNVISNLTIMKKSDHRGHFDALHTPPYDGKVPGKERHNPRIRTPRDGVGRLPSRIRIPL